MNYLKRVTIVHQTHSPKVIKPELPSGESAHLAGSEMGRPLKEAV